jgi:uncharacterized protein YdiU (UPF0061 family)
MILGFSALQYRLFWEFTSPRKESRPHRKETPIVDQLLQHMQTEETSYRNLFSQLDHVPSKHELPLSYMVAVFTILWPFVQMLPKHLSPAPVV